MFILQKIVKFSFTFFLLFSFLIFFFLFNHPQAIVYDANGYYYYGTKLYESNFNVLNFDFDNRTYIFPLYISCLVALSKLIKVNDIGVIYFFNYLLFILSVYLVNKAISAKNKIASIFFLILSAFNIVNLSFTNTILTESLVILFVCALFLLLNSEHDNKNIFLLGLVSSLNVLARPSNILLFFCIFIYVSILIRRNIYKILLFILPVIIFFGISVVNVYNIENRIGLFTNKTQNIYEMQVRVGERYLKYETSVDKNYKNADIFYENKLAMDLYNEKCKKPFNCLISYFIKDPVEYSIILGIHTFNLFDRVYINTYVESMDNIDNSIVIYNYLILSSFLCFFIFIFDLKKFKNDINLYISFFILLFGTISIYIPTVIESRFSSSVYPLFIMMTSFYFVDIYKKRNGKLIRKTIICQFLIIFFFLILSYLIRQNAILYLK